MTSSSTNGRALPEPWEVWLAYVRFDDHSDVGKVRPVAILDNEVSTVIVAKVTTAQPHDHTTVTSSASLPIGQLRGFYALLASK